MKVQRRINRTGRKRISHGSVEIRLHCTDRKRPPTFTAQLRLDHLHLPEEADVYVEAYHGSSTQRFSFGKVGNLTPSSNTTLDDVDLSGALLFRVKVVTAREHAGRLLAACDAIRPLDPGEEPGRDALLSVKAVALGDRTWELDLHTEPTGSPVLELNYRIPDAIRQIQQNPVFQGLIFPPVIREILGFIFWDCDASEGFADDEDLGASPSWQRDWLAFGTKLCGTEPPSEDDSTAARHWIDDVVTEFSRSFDLSDRLIAAMEGDE